MVLKEPGRVTLGDGISAFVVCQSPPLDEALIVDLMAIPTPETRVSATDHGGDACRRLEINGSESDR